MHRYIIILMASGFKATLLIIHFSKYLKGQLIFSQRRYYNV